MIPLIITTLIFTYGFLMQSSYWIFVFVFSLLGLLLNKLLKTVSLYLLDVYPQHKNFFIKKNKSEKSEKYDKSYKDEDDKDEDEDEDEDEDKNKDKDEKDLIGMPSGNTQFILSFLVFICLYLRLNGLNGFSNSTNIYQSISNNKLIFTFVLSLFLLAFVVIYQSYDTNNIYQIIVGAFVGSHSALIPFLLLNYIYGKNINFSYSMVFSIFVLFSIYAIFIGYMKDAKDAKDEIDTNTKIVSN